MSQITSGLRAVHTSPTVWTAFDMSRVEVRHKSGIPYTHCYMECTRK